MENAESALFTLSSFHHTFWDGGYKVPWRLGVVGLARAASIDSLEVYCAPRVAIGFGCDHHPALPLRRRVHRDSL